MVAGNEGAISAVARVLKQHIECRSICKLCVEILVNVARHNSGISKHKIYLNY